MVWNEFDLVNIVHVCVSILHVTRLYISISDICNEKHTRFTLQEKSSDSIHTGYETRLGCQCSRVSLLAAKLSMTYI